MWRRGFCTLVHSCFFTFWHYHPYILQHFNEICNSTIYTVERKRHICVQDQNVCGIVVPHTRPVCMWYCGAPYRTSMCVVLWCPIQDQYVFIHDAILEAVICGDTQIESGDLRAKLDKMHKKSQSGKTELELQFAVSPLITTTSYTSSIHCNVC